MADNKFTLIHASAFRGPTTSTAPAGGMQNAIYGYNPEAQYIQTITVQDTPNGILQDEDATGGSGRHSQDIISSYIDNDGNVAAPGAGIYSSGFYSVVERDPDGTVVDTFKIYFLNIDTNNNASIDPGENTTSWLATEKEPVEGNSYSFSYLFPSAATGNVEYSELATFAAPEGLVAFAAPDGVVDGEETGETMGPGYDDSGQATDGGGDIIDGADGDDDIIHGNGGDDTINAGAGSDVVYGGDGNDVVLDDNNDNTSDTIYGGAGDDNLDGGGGADYIYGGVGNDIIDGGSGGDTIVGGAGDDYIFQSQNNGSLYDNQADSIDAGAGNDTIVGSFGADTIDGGDGIDLYDASPRGQQIVADLESGSVEYLNTATTGANAQQISNIENFYGGHGSDSIAGDGEDNVLHGNEGADTISGRGGDDTIDGGIGNDSIDGGTGNDSIDGGEGNDVLNGGAYVVPTAPTGTNSVSVIRLSGGDQDGNASNAALGDVYNPIEQTFFTDDATFRPVVGSSIDLADGTSVTLTDVTFADTLITYSDGTTASANYLYVELSNGEVYLSSNSSEDDLLYAADKEVTSFEISGGVNSNPTEWWWDAFDGLSDPVDLAGVDGGDDTLDGGEGDDRLYGGDGNDQLDGGAGDDRLYGNEGDDIMSGGDGDDYLRGGDGDDTLTGGDGDDAYRIYETAGQGAGLDIITDFGTGNTGPIDDGNRLNNDNINLSDFYNATNLAAWNAANPSQQYATALGWLRADQADDGVLNNTFAGWDANNTLTIQNGGVAVAGSELTYDTTNVVCFLRGTRIKTINGEILVEELSQGDKVLTVDNGYQPIRWIGSRNFSAKQLLDHKNLRPVRIRAAALGSAFPETDLLVSQQHRVLVSSKIAQRMFDGSPEVLVAAKHLVLIDGIDIVNSQGVEYYHFLFDRHEVVFSNGAKTESMYTGPEALKSVSSEARHEILTIFPDLASIDYEAMSCRPLVNGRMGRKLAIRHKNNSKNLFS